MPGIIMLSFDISFQEDVNNYLDFLINSKHYKKTIFHSFSPEHFGYSFTSSGQEKEKGIHDFFLNLRIKAESFISKYIRGYFLSNSGKEGPLCPCVEIFSISEFPQTKETLKEEQRQHRDFWQSLGFELLYDSKIYKSSNLFFLTPTKSSDELSYPYRLIFTKKGTDTRHFESLQTALRYEARDFLQGYIYGISLQELCERMMSNVAKYRITTGKGLFSNRFSFRRFTKLLKLDEGISREIFLINRLILEYEHVKNSKWWDFSRSEAEQLANSKFKLSNYFLNSIDYHFNLIKNQYNTTSEDLKRYLSGINIKTSYKLQRNILWLTVILVIGLLLQIYISSPEKWKNLFHTILSQLNK